MLMILLFCGVIVQLLVSSLSSEWCFVFHCMLMILFCCCCWCRYCLLSGTTHDLSYIMSSVVRNHSLWSFFSFLFFFSFCLVNLSHFGIKFTARLSCTKLSRFFMQIDFSPFSFFSCDALLSGLKFAILFSLTYLVVIVYVNWLFAGLKLISNVLFY